MRFATSLAAAAICLFLGACGTEKSAETTPSAATEQPIDTDTVVAVAPPTHLNACGERMKGFLRWYLAQVDPQKEHPEGTYVSFKWPITPETDSAFAAGVKPEDRSTTKYIQMDWPSIDKYVATLRKSGYFSESYLREKRASIIERGKAMEAEKMEDGVFDGFDVDEVFRTQELYEPGDVERLQPYKDARLKPGSFAYKVPTAVPYFGFLLYLKNENGQCVLDSVAHWRDEALFLKSVGM
jgi:hypothetical protein